MELFFKGGGGGEEGEKPVTAKPPVFTQHFFENERGNNIQFSFYDKAVAWP